MARIRQQVVTSIGYVEDVDALLDGGWIATWVLYYENANEIVYQTRFDAAGKRVGQVERLDSSLLGSQTSPMSVAHSDGGWITVFNYGHGDVLLERFDKAGHRVGKLQTVNTTTKDLQFDPSIAVLKSGYFVVTWESSGQVDYSIEIYQQLFDTNGKKVGKEALVNSATQFQQYDSHVTALADGGWIVKYHSDWFNGDAYQRFDSHGGKVGSETKTEAGGVTVGLPDGGWVTAHEVNNRIKMVRHDSDGKQVGDSVLVTDVSSEQSYSPTITVLPNGGWLIVSTDRMIIDENVVEPYFSTFISQRQYDSNGNAIGASRHVNDTGGDVVSGSSVSVLKDGGWIVTWSQGGVSYQKRYEVNGKVWFKNDAPVGVDRSVAVEKDGSHRFAIDEFEFVDKNGDHLKGVILDKLPSIGRVTLSGHIIKTGEFVVAADISKLIWTAPANKLGSDVTTLLFRVVDDAGTAHQGADTDKTANLLTFDLLKSLRGSSKADVIVGGKQAEIFLGYSGNDKLTGGVGADVLTGSSGGDHFIYKSLTDSTVSKSGQDTLLDFSGKSADRIDLVAIDANSKTNGNQTFSFIGESHFRGQAGELRYEKRVSDTYIYADVNGDKKADFAIHLDDAVTLSKGYFLL